MSDLDVINAYLFDRYDKLVPNDNKPMYLVQGPNDKRFNIIHFIDKYNVDGDYMLDALSYNFRFNYTYAHIGTKINANPKTKYFKTYITTVVKDIYVCHRYYKNSSCSLFINKLLEAINKEKHPQYHEKSQNKNVNKLIKKQNTQWWGITVLSKIFQVLLIVVKFFLRQLFEIKNMVFQIIRVFATNYNHNKKRKKNISSTMRRLVWNAHVGEHVGKTKCLCCNTTDITSFSFNCGHIVAEAKGGKTIVSNLKPICQNCNSCMGTKNMDEFKKSLFT